MENNRKIAVSGLMTALIVITLYLADILPTLKFSLFVISGIIIAFVCAKQGAKTALLVFLASLVLAGIILPTKVPLFAFGIYFGLYSIVKFLCESKGLSLVAEWIIKILYINIATGFAYFFATELLELIPPNISNIWIILFAVVNVGLVVYDYFFTSVISYVLTRFKNIG